MTRLEITPAGPTPIATTSVAGKVKPDGTTISVAGDGTITNTGQAVALQDKGGQVYNVMAYGVTADGATDDTAAINTLITTVNGAGGGRILFPAGKTIIAAGIVLKSNVTLDIPATCHLKLKANVTSDLINATNVSNVSVIGGGELDGNQANQAQDGTTINQAVINLSGVTDFRLDGLYVHDGRGFCVAMTTSTARGRVGNCRFDLAGNDCLLVLGGCSNIHISNCYASNGGATVTPVPNAIKTGYEVADDCRDIAFVNCNAEYNADNGFGIHNHPNVGGPYGVTLSGCIARNTGVSSTGVATNSSASAYGFDILAQDAIGPDAINLTGCIALGGDAGFHIGEIAAVGAGGAPTLGTVTLAGCTAGGTYTTGGVVGTANSPGTYGFQLVVGSNTADKAITLTGCTAERIGNGVGTTGIGFLLSATTQGYLRPVSLSSCIARSCTQYGFEMTKLYSAVLSGCMAFDNANYGFYAPATSQRGTLSGCKSRANSASGFVILGDDWQLAGCAAIANAGGAGYVIQANRTLLSGCVATGQTDGTNGFGFQVNSAGASTTMTGCIASGNTKAGFNIANVTRPILSGCVSASNSTWGLQVQGSTDLMTVDGCQFYSNSSGQVSLNTPATTHWLTNNQGYNPVGSVTPPVVPASTTAQKNTFGVPVTVFVAAGTVTDIAVGGTSTGLTGGAFRVMPGQNITLTYSVAPTWSWFGD